VEVERAGREVDHSNLFLSRFRTRGAVTLYLHFPVRLHGLVLNESQGQLYHANFHNAWSGGTIPPLPRTSLRRGNELSVGATLNFGVCDTYTEAVCCLEFFGTFSDFILISRSDLSGRTFVSECKILVLICQK
jgi:hypothetical protein